MTSSKFARVHYFPKQYLRTGDFTAEQQYHVEQIRRHRRLAHTWGILAGLQTVYSEEEGFFIQPGTAIDGYGRELCLTARKPLSLRAFDEKGSDKLDVWLLYNKVPAENAPAGYTGCGPRPTDAFYRWVEQPTVTLRKPDFGDPRQPWGVVDVDPDQTGTDDPDLLWPVIIGRMTRDRSDPENTVYQTEDIPLAYAGLTGAALTHPADPAVRLQLGRAHAEDPNLFSLHIGDDAKPSLQVGNEGGVSLNDPVQVRGDLELGKGSLHFDGSADQVPLPYQIYRYDQVNEEGQTLGQEIRIQLPQGTEEAPGKLVVGSHDGNAFQPVLTVEASGNVRVHGNLRVDGGIQEGQIVPGQFSAEALQTILGMQLSGITAFPFSGLSEGAGAAVIPIRRTAMAFSGITEADLPGVVEAVKAAGLNDKLKALMAAGEGP